MLENNTENRETLASLIVSYWDMDELIVFAETKLVDEWDADVVGKRAADESWSCDVAVYRDQLDNVAETSEAVFTERNDALHDADSDVAVEFKITTLETSLNNLSPADRKFAEGLLDYWKNYRYLSKKQPDFPLSTTTRVPTGRCVKGARRHGCTI